MSRRPLPPLRDLPLRGLFVGGSAGGRMGARPLGSASLSAARERSAEATTSFLLWDENVRLLIDLGTGLGATVEVARLLRQRNPDAEEFLALTHYHEDHWCGLRWCGPFSADDLPRKAFSPAFSDGFSRDAANTGEPPLRRLIERLDEPGFWPTPVLDPTCRIEHATFAPGESLSTGNWTIRTCLLPHPGGCIGYRVELPEGPVVAVATDCELDSDSPSEDERRSLDAFFESVDLLVLDVQYLDDEYDGKLARGDAARDRRGWGHNSPRLVARTLARIERLPRVILLTHHDPDRTISDLYEERIARELSRRLSESMASEGRRGLNLPTIVSLLDGDLWNLESPAEPRRIDDRASATERESRS